MFKRITCLLIACIMLASFTVLADAHDFEFEYDYVGAFIEYYGCDPRLSFVSEDGTFDTYAFTHMSGADLRDELSKYFIPSEHLYNCPIFQVIVYGKNLDAEDFSMLENVQVDEIFGIIHIRPTNIEEISEENGYADLSWEEKITRRCKEIMEMIEGRIGDDIKWIDPFYMPLVEYDDVPSTSVNTGCHPGYTKCLGDVNADGYINLKDVSLLIRLQAGWDVQTANEDYNNDGQINMRDTALLIKFIAGE